VEVTPPWVTTQVDLCKEGSEYCWMACLPLPEEDCGSNGHVCMNDLAEECDGFSHNGSCEWVCRVPPGETQVNWLDNILKNIFNVLEITKSAHRIVTYVLYVQIQSELAITEC